MLKRFTKIHRLHLHCRILEKRVEQEQGPDVSFYPPSKRKNSSIPYIHPYFWGRYLKRYQKYQTLSFLMEITKTGHIGKPIPSVYLKQLDIKKYWKTSNTQRTTHLLTFYYTTSSAKHFHPTALGTCSKTKQSPTDMLFGKPSVLGTTRRKMRHFDLIIHDYHTLKLIGIPQLSIKGTKEFKS